MDNKDITQPSQLKQWKYLEHITNQFNFEDDLPVGLLIRANYVKAIEPLEILQSRNEGPYAFKTRLGWCIVGPVSQNNKNTVSCNRIAVRQADTKQVGTHFFQVGNQVHDNEVPDMLKKIYNDDFTESYHMANKEVGTSQEDERFLQILEEGAKLVNGHYEIPLPFRRVDIQLPNNKVQAEKRLASLKKKMARNNKFKDDYIEFMKELTSKGYAKESSKVAESGHCWYSPHHGVYHPNKSGKIRVVFDLSAEHYGVSINKKLLPGPDLTNQIVEMLLRFKEEPIAVTGDIKAMFHQAKVPEKERNYLRFLWWKDSDLDKYAVDHEMTVHVFGEVSPLSCQIYAVKKTASDNLKRYGENVASILRRNFYVDDMLKSFSSIEEAIGITGKVK